MHSKVFTLAHQIKNLFVTFSDALKAAWRIIKIKMEIPVEIAFRKKDSDEVREAKAVGLGSLQTVEKGYLRFIEETEQGTQWRAFRIANLIFSPTQKAA